MNIISTLMACGLLTGMVQAKDYTLYKKGHLPATGTTFTKESTMVMPNMAMDITVQGQQMQSTMTMKQSEVEVLEFKSAIEVKQTLQSSKTENTVTMMGQTMPQPAPPAPLLNIPILFKKGATDWTASGEKEKLSDEQQKLADADASSFAKAGFYYGEEKRSVGDSWAVDPNELKNLMSQENGKATGKATITFQEVVKNEGKECAKLLIDFDMKLLEEAPAKMEIGLAGKVTILRDLENFVDVAVDGTMKMTMNGSANGAAMKGSGDTTISEKVTITQK